MDVKGVNVVAVCDIDPDRMNAAAEAASAKGYAPAVYEDFRKMLDEVDDIDAVVIATPVNTHQAIAIGALETGKNVYCEKPMALTPEESHVMVQAANSAKGIFQAGFQLRHDPNRRTAMEFIQRGGIGKVLFMQG